MRRRSSARVLAAMASAVLLLLGPVSALARHHASHQHGTLRISASGLHHGEHPRLLVRGPHGFQRRVHAGKHALTLTRLRAGSYRITAKSTTLAAAAKIPAGSRDYASPTHVKARVRAGRTARVKLRYGNVIVPGVRISTPAPQSFTGTATNPTSITLPGGSKVKVGQIVYYPPSARFPLGVFSKITAISHQGATVTVTLSPAALSDAFPEINVRVVLPISRPGGGAADRVFATPVAHAAGLSFDFVNGPFSCGSSLSTPPTLSLPVSLSPSLDAQLHKPLFGSLTARFVIGLSGSAGIKLFVPEDTGCDVEFPGAGPFPIGVIPIGPIEIPVTASVKPSASIRTQGELKVDAGVSLTTHAGFTYSGGQFSRVFDASPSGHATAEFPGGSFKIGPELQIAAGLAETLDANVSVGLFHAIQGSASSWQIGLDLDVEAALEAEGIGSLKLPVFEKFFPTSSYGIPGG
jgi:hypothetical protein